MIYDVKSDFLGQETESVITKKSLISACAIMGILVLCGTNNLLFTMSAFIFGIILCVKADIVFSLCVLFFTLPMATIFKLSPGQTSLFTFLQLMWVICSFYKMGLKANRKDVSVILFTFYLIICQIFNGGFSVSATLKLSFGLLMVLMVNKIPIYKYYKEVFMAYIGGVLASSLMMHINSSLFHITAYVNSKTERLVGSAAEDRISRFSGLYGDPNYYSVNLIVSMVLILILYKKKKLTSMQSVILIMPFVYFAAKTGSKSALFMLAIPASLFVYISLRNRHYLISVISIIAIGVGIWMIFNGKIAAFSIAIQRLTSSHANINELTTGRGEKWADFLFYIIDRPFVLLFGRSLLNFILNGGAPHNTYIDFLFQLGLVGTIWLAGILFSAWHDCKKYGNKRDVLNYSLVLTVAILYFFLSELQYADFPFHIVLCLIVAGLNFREKSAKGEINEY